MAKSSARDVILDTSESLFNAYGFHAVGVDRIQDVSGVSKVTMYKYFKSKNDLIFSVLKRRDEYFIESLSKIISSKKTLSDKISCVIEWHLEWFSQPTFKGCMYVNANKEFGMIDDEIKEFTKSHKQRFFNLILGIFDVNAPARKILANTLYLYVEGAISEVALTGSTLKIEESRMAFQEWLIKAASSTI